MSWGRLGALVPLLLACAAWAAPPGSSPAVGPLPHHEAEVCAQRLALAARLIARNYYQNVSEAKLLGAAALALCRAAGAAPPAALLRDPDGWLDGDDAVKELAALRLALGR